MNRAGLGLLLAALLLSLAAPVSLGAQSDQDVAHVDGMDGLTPALLTEQSPDPAQFTYAYNDGQYNMTALSPTFSGDFYSYLTLGAITDSSTAVDVAIENDGTNKYAFVGCRAGDNDHGYAFEVFTSTGEARIWILGDDTGEILAEGVFPEFIAPGFVYNTIEIECFQNLITGSINGEVVLAGSDGTFSEGHSYVGGGVISSNPGQLNLIFDNLSVTHYGAAAAPAAASASTTLQTSLQPGLEGAIAFATANAPIAGPFEASAEVFDGDLKVLPAGVAVSTFYAEFGFFTPSNVPPGLWTAGLCFWRAADDSCLELTVGSTGTDALWFLGDVGAGGSYDLLDRGDLTGIELIPGGRNTIGLFVEGQTATLTVNSNAAAVVITLPRTGFGDIAAVLSYLAQVDDEPGSYLMETFGFAVWDLTLGQAGGAALTPVAQPTIPAVPTTPAQPTIPAQPTAVVEPTVPAQPATGNDPGAPAFEQLRSQAIAQPPVSGPAAGSLTESAGTFPYAMAGVDLGDLYATVTFANPLDTSVPWNIGIGVHYTIEDGEFRFLVDSSGQWMTAMGGGGAEPGGMLANFNPAPGATNTIEVIIWQGTAWVAVNNVLVSSLDISGYAASGDVFIGTSFLGIDAIEGRQIPYQEFSVFALPGAIVGAGASTTGNVQTSPQGAGPYAGVLIERTGGVAVAPAGVALADLHASATFLVPEDQSATFQIGFGFRNVGGNDQYRLLVNSDGAWSLSFGVNPAILTGTVTNFLTTPGAENTLSIDVQGTSGTATLNGVQFATLDLSSWTTAGDVWVGTGVVVEATVDGRMTQYRDFIVEPR